MTPFVCLFIPLPQIRSENQNKETRDIPRGGITYVVLALGFALAKMVCSLSCYWDTPNSPRSPFHLLASRPVESPILKERGELALSGFLGSLQIFPGFRRQIFILRISVPSPPPTSTGKVAGKQEKEGVGGRLLT